MNNFNLTTHKIFVNDPLPNPEKRVKVPVLLSVLNIPLDPKQVIQEFPKGEQQMVSFCLN